MGHRLAEQPAGLLEAGGAEDGANRRPDQLLQVLGAVPQRIAEEVHGATLPGAAQHLGDGLLEALVGVGDHQLHARQAAADQAAQELPPERLGLGRTHIQADDLTLAGLVPP
jgi:hypothetical protein